MRDQKDETLINNRKGSHLKKWTLRMYVYIQQTTARPFRNVISHTQFTYYRPTLTSLQQMTNIILITSCTISKCIFAIKRKRMHPAIAKFLNRKGR